MEIANNTKPPKLRILGGPIQKVELELNAILDEYAPTVWMSAAVGDHIEVAVVCLSISELRKAGLAAGGGPMPGRR